MQFRRRVPRQIAGWIGSCRIEGEPANEPMKCRVLDISEFGIGIMLDDPRGSELIGLRISVETPTIGTSVHIGLEGEVRNAAVGDNGSRPSRHRVRWADGTGAVRRQSARSSERRSVGPGAWTSGCQRAVGEERGPRAFCEEIALVLAPQPYLRVPPPGGERISSSGLAQSHSTRRPYSHLSASHQRGGAVPHDQSNFNGAPQDRTTPCPGSDCRNPRSHRRGLRLQRRSVEWWASQHKLVHDLRWLRWRLDGWQLDGWQWGRCVLNIA